MPAAKSFFRRHLSHVISHVVEAERGMGAG
jgi:hypothetical protein